MPDASFGPAIPEALQEAPNVWRRYSRSLSRHRSAVFQLFYVWHRFTPYPQDPAEGFILNYTLLIGDASFSNFQKVCVSKCNVTARDYRS